MNRSANNHLRRRSAVPDLDVLLRETAARSERARGGTVATYIPELANADPDRFAIALCTTDGRFHTLGDVDHRFTIQSAGKPFLYASALARFGPETVHQRVGVEPTGQEFNSFTRLESGTHRPHNPMINAGAIAVTDLLITGVDGQPRRKRHLLQSFSRLVGEPEMDVDQSVFESERGHATRNRVIAYLMKHFERLTFDVESVLECYFTACAAVVDCRRLALMAACLAGDGIHPESGERVLPEDVVPQVLSVMTTCGMYDASGKFAHQVGLPAKSGVSGAILAVVPGRYGVAVFAPRVDRAGNSVRGWASLRHLATGLRGHFFQPRRRAPHVITRDRAADDLAAIAAGMREAAMAVEGGRVAGYLPQVDRGLFGVAICTVHGEEVCAGDSDHRFSMQAVANPMAYALAMQAHGSRAVHRLVGVEPSGNPYHEIIVNMRTRRPYNPLNNAGAIAIAGLEAGQDELANRFRTSLCAWGGGADTIDVDQAVMGCEREAGSRNRAIANLLLELGAISDVDASLERYFRQCSCLVTCRTLARIAATLANAGVQPLTRERVLRRRAVRDMLTVMYTCGMHDQSGRFALDVGLPAKSGISGGIMAVAPGRFGVAAFAPPVDEAGTSVRGRIALRRLADALGLSVFAPHHA